MNRDVMQTTDMANEGAPRTDACMSDRTGAVFRDGNGHFTKVFDRLAQGAPRLRLEQALWRLQRQPLTLFEGLSLRVTSTKQPVACRLAGGPEAPGQPERPLSGPLATSLLQALVLCLFEAHQSGVVGLRWHPEALYVDDAGRWRSMHVDFEPHVLESTGGLEYDRRSDVLAVWDLVQDMTDGLVLRSPSSLVTALETLFVALIHPDQALCQVLGILDPTWRATLRRPLSLVHPASERHRERLMQAVHGGFGLAAFYAVASGPEVLDEWVFECRRTLGRRILRVRAEGSDRPLSALIDLVSQLNEWLPDAELRDGLRAVEAPEASDVVWVSSARVARRHLAQILAQGLRRLASEEGFCLVVADAHLACPDTREWFGQIRSLAEELSITLCLLQPVDAPREFTDWPVLDFDAVSDEACARLAQNAVWPHVISDADTAALWRESAGCVALMTRGCLRALRGNLSTGEWSVLALNTMPTTSVRELLRAVAVLGHAVSLYDLWRLMDVPAEWFFEMVEEALLEGFLLQSGPYVSFVRFDEPERLLVAMTESDRARWHRRIASSDAFTVEERLSHALRCGLEALFADVVFQAAARLYVVGAERSSLVVLNHAIRIFEHERGLHQRLALLRVHVLLDDGDVGMARQGLAALASTDDPDLEALRTALAYQTGHAQIDRVQLRQALMSSVGVGVKHYVRVTCLQAWSKDDGDACEWYGEVLDTALNGIHPAMQAEAHLWCARLLACGIDHDGVAREWHLLEAVRLGRRSGAWQTVLAAWQDHAEWALASDQLNTARTLLQQLQAAHRLLDWDDERVFVLASVRLASLWLTLAQFEQAEVELLRLDSESIWALDEGLWLRWAVTRAQAWWCQGRLAQASSLLDEMAAAAGDREIAPDVRDVWLAWIDLLLGYGAIEQAQDYLGRLAPADDPAWHLAWANWFALAGDARAGEYYEGMRAAAASQGRSLCLVQALLGLAREGVPDGDPALIEQRLNAARALAEMLGARVLLLQVWLEMGWFYGQEQRRGQAIRAFEVALDLAEGVDHPQARALALAGLALYAVNAEHGARLRSGALAQLNGLLVGLDPVEQSRMLSLPVWRRLVSVEAAPGADPRDEMAPGEDSQASLKLADEVFALLSPELDFSTRQARLNAIFTRRMSATRGVMFVRTRDGDLKLADRLECADNPEQHLLPEACAHWAASVVSENGQLLWIPNTATYAKSGEEQPDFLREGIRGLICVPLLDRGTRPDGNVELLGCWYGDRTEAWDDLTETEREAISLLGRYAAVVMATGMFQEVANTRAQRLEMLNDLSAQIVGTVDQERLLSVALARIMAVSHGEQGYIFWGESLSLRARLPESAGALDLQFSRSVVARVVRERQPLAILDIGEDAEFGQKVSLVLRNVRSVMCVPLMRQGNLLGIIYVSSSTANKTFTGQDLEWVTAVAAQVSLALQTTQAFDTITELNASLEAKVTERTGELQKTIVKLQETQSQLLEVEKLASIGTLAGGVAHELNNPLAAVLSNAQLLMLDIEDPEQLDSLKLIEEGARRCKQIVQSLLTYASDTRATFEAVAVSELVSGVLVALTPRLENAGVQVTLDLSVLPPILGEKQELHLVFAQLLANAIDAIIERGEGFAGHIQWRVRREFEGVLISIEDNGVGMSDDTRHRVFDPFFTTKRIGSGVGMGLSMCQRLIQKHGGHLQITSQAGVGTCVLVTLPVP